MLHCCEMNHNIHSYVPRVRVHCKEMHLRFSVVVDTIFARCRWWNQLYIGIWRPHYQRLWRVSSNCISPSKNGREVMKHFCNCNLTEWQLCTFASAREANLCHYVVWTHPTKYQLTIDTNGDLFDDDCSGDTTFGTMLGLYVIEHGGEWWRWRGLQ